MKPPYNRYVMFETLTEKLNGVFQRLAGKGRLTEKDVDEALREVRMALLEADVNFRVVRDFVGRVREKAVGRDVLESITPGQQVMKLVHDELVNILSGGEHKLTSSSSPPTVVMMAGLQGSGKTTTTAKMALQFRKRGQRSLLVAADLRRPAAIDQLVTLGKQLSIDVYREDTSSTAVKVAKAGVEKGREMGVHWVFLDTGGRLHIDDEMMEELKQIRAAVSPHETLLVLDAMTGQDAVRAAQEFHQRVPLTGLVLTKMDGDARGGAALSVTEVTGVPIKFIGAGEKSDALEPFYPDRLSSRILGMGDVVTLVERAQEAVDEAKVKEMERKFRQASFDLDDFLEQIQAIRKMGSFGQVMEMIPGFSAMSKRLPQDAFDEEQVKRVEAMIRSMTPEERSRPEIIRGSRRRRIATGSGTQPQDVSRLINQFRQAQKMMKRLASGRGPGMLKGLFG